MDFFVATLACIHVLRLLDNMLDLTFVFFFLPSEICLGFLLNFWFHIHQVIKYTITI